MNMFVQHNNYVTDAAPRNSNNDDDSTSDDSVTSININLGWLALAYDAQCWNHFEGKYVKKWSVILPCGH